jgi:cysteinyl-tRNA synthetase
MSQPAPIQIYNTLSRRVEALRPLREGEVGIYLCGPTVYDDCHIGHLMGPVLFDVVARWLRARGYRVRLVNNITDIDDKIINRANADGVAWDAITTRYTAQYLGYLKHLHVVTVTDHPKCSEYIPQMVRYVADLIAKGRAYVAEDGVYYDVQQQPDYGKLSGRHIENMLVGTRVDRTVEGRRHSADFALWKLAKPGEPSWDSPWGQGRPGWHIECSVMSNETLGSTFDIHAGGDDLKFPHHENEIAQGEAHGGEYAKCWMHNGLIQYESVKIGKSDQRMQDPAFRRQFQADHLLGTVGAATVRFLLLQGHYRRPNDFAPSALQAARTALAKLHRDLGPLLDEPLGLSDAALLADIMTRNLPLGAVAARTAVAAAMDDDFATGTAIAALFALRDRLRAEYIFDANESNRQISLRTLRDLGRLLGLFQPGDGKDTGVAAADDEEGAAVAAAMAKVLALRQTVRAQKRFADSDKIRAALTAAGIVVKDGKDGASWQWAPDAARDHRGALAAVQGLLATLG